MSELDLRKELKGPDKFFLVLEKLVVYAKENKRNVMIGCGVFAAILLFFVLLSVSRTYKENKAEKVYTELLKKYETLVEIEGFEKTYATTKPEFLAFLSKYGKTKIGKLANLSFGHLAYEASDYNAALEFYEKSLNDFKKHPIIKALIISNMGMCYESLKNYDKAAEQFAKITSDINAISKDEALFHLGYIYSKVGRQDLANDAFNNLVKIFPDSIYTGVLKEKLATAK